MYKHIALFVYTYISESGPGGRGLARLSIHIVSYTHKHIYICIYSYIHWCIYIYMYVYKGVPGGCRSCLLVGTFPWPWPRAQSRAPVHWCIRLILCIHMCTCMYTCEKLSVCVCLFMCVPMYIERERDIYTYMFMCTNIFMYVYISACHANANWCIYSIAKYTCQPLEIGKGLECTYIHIYIYIYSYIHIFIYIYTRIFLTYIFSYIDTRIYLHMYLHMHTK